MKDIKALNKELETDSKELEKVIEELAEREEFACTAEGCGGQACGIN